MPSDPADPAPPARRAARPSGAGGFLLVVLLVLALVTTACSSDEKITPPRAPADSSGSRADAAQRTLDLLVSALSAGSAADAQRLATSDARDLLTSVTDNARALRLTQVSMRYVDEGSPLDAAQRAQYGKGAWTGTVDLVYAFGGLDRTPSRVETEIVFVPDGSRASIATFGGDEVRTPLWLVDRLSVVRRGRMLTAVDADTAGRYPGLVAHAVVQVRRTLPSWQGPLVVEVPGSQAELERAVRSEPGEYDNIAAVTTTEDGSLATGAPVRVFVNPQVFGKLRQRGAQVVLSHEATHVATGATFVSMPTWLLEGFADYVALRRAGVPVSLAAGQILKRIRKDGLPQHLPTSSDLDPTANGLGATYEEAWLACRFLGQAFGEQRLVGFYRTVSAGTPVEKAFRTVLGTTQQQFVARWRTDLARLAGVAG